MLCLFVCNKSGVDIESEIPTYDESYVSGSNDLKYDKKTLCSKKCQDVMVGILVKIGSLNNVVIGNFHKALLNKWVG